ncbi:MAG: hypothetical protein IJ037_04905 [Clostridia bacterium]|nr:hypothetical protein [Clostridia bacterium]
MAINPKIWRDNLAKLFLPENQQLLNDLPDDRMDEIRRVMLGTEEPETCLRSRYEKTPEEDPELYLNDKLREYRAVNFRYAKIFDLCRVIGVKNIYDIGCQGINQALQLVNYSAMSYTGMDLSFSFNDWRTKDRETNNYHLPITGEAPPPFCNGRIRFVKGWYPETALDVQEDSIFVSCYAMTMTRPENIPAMAQALQRNFDRMLFNVLWSREEALNAWKSADWTGYAIHPIGPCGFVFATRHPEDIARLKKLYPCDDRGWFDTGIDNGTLHMTEGIFPTYRSYTDWRRDL